MKAQQILLFLLVSLTALSFLDSPGTGDVGAWMGYLHNVETHGIVAGFEASEELYPPLSFVILFMVAKASRLFQIDLFLGLKLSLALFLLLTSLAFWAWTKSLFITAMMQATLILNSVALGYIDIYFAPTLLLSLWALRARKLLLFTVFFSITCLIKWQPIVIAPFVLIYILDVKAIEDWRQIDSGKLMMHILLPLLSIFAFVLSVFGFKVILAFSRAISEDVLSANALNFNWVLTHLLHTFYPDAFGGLVDGRSEYILTTDLRITALPRLIFFALYTMALVALFRREKTFENVILYSLIGYLAYFTFNPGVHENHLFLVSILASVLPWIDRNHLSTFVTWSLVANINLLVFYGVRGEGLLFSRVMGVDLAFPLSILNVLLFVEFFIGAMRKTTARGLPTS